MAKLKVIITGATGMVGEGVLHICLQHPGIEKVLVIGRRPSGVNSPKLQEIILPDLFQLTEAEKQLQGYDACFFCLGISSVGISAEDYYQTTYTLTVHVAEILCKMNPLMTFCYISGAGTDSTEKGRIRWARVKGKTENDLIKLPFKQVFGVRPGFIKPIKGLKRINPLYKYVNWMFPLGRKFFPGGFCTLEELALAMIRLASGGYSKKIIEGKDIRNLAKLEIEKD